MKARIKKLLPYLPYVLIFAIAIVLRVLRFEGIGNDAGAYLKAVEDFKDGVNPYEWTIETYNSDDMGNHGFAYLPGLLYLFTFLSYVSVWTSIPLFVLSKVPVLLADLAVGYLLVKILRNKSYIFSLIALAVWLFNPYFVLKGNYVYLDPIPIYLMFLSVYFVDRNSVLSGFAYALSIATKTFPYLLFPLMLAKVKNKGLFIIVGLLVAVLVSIPFMKSMADFLIYLEGAVFVHSERFLQGRPLLFYISYFYHVEFIQLIPLRTYTLLASFSGWLILIPLLVRAKGLSKYALAVIPFLTFYVFTPVFNKTYLLWFLPLFLTGAYESLNKLNKFLPYLVTGVFYIFYTWYLVQWTDGFHVWRPW